MKRYAVKVRSEWSEDIDGTWFPANNEQVVAICDSKEKAKDLILKAIHEVAEKLKSMGEEFGIIEELNDGWRYRIKPKEGCVIHAFTRGETYETCCEEFEEGILDEIEL